MKFSIVHNNKNNFAKFTTLLLLITVSLQNLTYTIGKSDLIDKINKVYTNSFDKQPLLAEALKLDEWNKTTKEVNNFVKEKAKSNDDLKGSSTKALGINEDLINHIKLVYNLSVKGQNKENPKIDWELRQKYFKITEALESLNEKAKKIKVKSGMFSSSESDAKTVLEGFISKLVNLQKKFGIEYRNLVNKYAKMVNLKTKAIADPSFKTLSEIKINEKPDFKNFNRGVDGFQKDIKNILSYKEYIPESEKINKFLSDILALKEESLNSISETYNLTIKPQKKDLPALNKILDKFDKINNNLKILRNKIGVSDYRVSSLASPTTSDLIKLKLDTFIARLIALNSDAEKQIKGKLAQIARQLK